MAVFPGLAALGGGIGKGRRQGYRTPLPRPKVDLEFVPTQRNSLTGPMGRGKRKHHCHATHHYQHGDCLGAPNSSRNILVAAQLVVLPQNGSDGCWFVLVMGHHHCGRIMVCASTYHMMLWPFWLKHLLTSRLKIPPTRAWYRGEPAHQGRGSGCKCESVLCESGGEMRVLPPGSAGSYLEKHATLRIQSPHWPGSLRIQSPHWPGARARINWHRVRVGLETCARHRRVCLVAHRLSCGCPGREGPQAGLPYPVASAKGMCRVCPNAAKLTGPMGRGKRKHHCHATYHYQRSVRPYRASARGVKSHCGCHTTCCVAAQ